MTAKMLLVDLPFDILESVLSNLDAYSAVACGLVCRLLHRVITSSLPIQYNIELAMRGMRAGNNESISLAERLEKLERYEVAWREGSWKESFRIDLRVPMRPNHICCADGHLVTWDPENGQVHVVRLPSPLRGISLAEYRWEFALAGVDRRYTRVMLDKRSNIIMFVRVTREVIDMRTTVRSDAHRLGTVYCLTCDARIVLYPFELSSGRVPKPATVLPPTTVELREIRTLLGQPCLRNEFLLLRLNDSKLRQGFAVYNWVTQRRLLKVNEDTKKIGYPHLLMATGR